MRTSDQLRNSMNALADETIKKSRAEGRLGMADMLSFGTNNKIDCTSSPDALAMLLPEPNNICNPKVCLGYNYLFSFVLALLSPPLSIFFSAIGNTVPLAASSAVSHLTTCTTRWGASISFTRTVLFNGTLMQNMKTTKDSYSVCTVTQNQLMH